MMLQRSFVHIPGIGSSTERKLWEQGVLHWAQLRQAASGTFRGKKLDTILEVLDRSETAYRARDLFYFYQTLPRDHLWRLVPECLDRIAYLDIETTGLGFPPMAHSTTITFYYQGKVYQEHERGKKRELIEWVLKECEAVCTFYGEVFDVPFLSREFGIEFNKPHFDLCFWLKRHSVSGGLKRIQKQFPEIPSRDSMDIDGYDAVRLWRLHESGVDGALETLLHYNAEDTVVLEPLLCKAFNLELKRQPSLGARAAEAPALSPILAPAFPELKTKTHSHVYKMLRDMDLQDARELGVPLPPGLSAGIAHPDRRPHQIHRG